MKGTIDNTDDIIDSRDVIARIAELEALAAEEDDFEEEYEDEAEELKSLKALAEEGEGLADWEYGEVLIRDSYFEEYAQQLADDVGAIDRNASWPICHIDWEAAANSLQMDYTSLDFDGVTYWARG